ncbi:tyrosine-type recombinase/integrase [Streptomyces sp. NPDC002886]|uniref:tyrosine-type recombinase/integrase n=1 Tax=Streptomyces sp. NPDC002886 TaxID=3364667 RepID=UPI0036BFC64B
MVEVVRRALMEGKSSVPELGAVAAGTARDLPFVLVDADGCEIGPVSAYLRDLMLGDVSPLTCRSYGFGLLRWHRLLWFLQIPWDKATEAEVAALVGWLREARNPQRLRKQNGASPPPGSVNLKTGKPSLREGYAPSTINHNLSVVSGFYAFHARFGVGPVVNPVPASRGRREALAHRSPLEPTPVFRRGRLRQKVPVQAPRSIPDHLWDELFAGMGCDRDRALLEFYVSSGARASELLGVGLDDVDWSGQLIYVISKGTRIRQPVPASPNAFRYLGSYLATDGLPDSGQPVWRTRRGDPRPLTYWATRRILQRANDKLGTNWTLHDARHTAAVRMAGDERLTLAEVQTILRHAHLDTTGRYLTARVEDLHDKLQKHYTKPRPQRTFAAGYDPEDIKAVFGG